MGLRWKASVLLLQWLLPKASRLWPKRHGLMLLLATRSHGVERTPSVLLWPRTLAVAAQEDIRARIHGGSTAEELKPNE